MSQFPNESAGAPHSFRRDEVKIDIKRIAYSFFQYWYFVVASLAICLTIAYLNNRYSEVIYPITASVVFREKAEASGADLLYKNSLIESNRNYLNEPYIIKSYPLIESVVKKLNFEVAFYQKGNIKTSEAYDLPVNAKLLNGNSSYGSSLIFKTLDENFYSIGSADETVINKEKKIRFNDSVEYMGHLFIIFKDSARCVKEITNVPYILTFSDPLDVAGSYIGRLNVQWAEERSGVLNLSVNGSSPAKEIDFMSGLISTYQYYDLEKKNQKAERTIQFIKGQLDGITDSLKISEGQLQQFKAKNSSEKLDQEATRFFNKLSSLEEQKTELIVRSNYYDYLVSYISKGGNLDLVVLPSSVGVNDGVVGGLVSKMIDMQLEIKLFMGKGRDENPLVRGGIRRLDEIKRDLSESIKTLKTTDKIKSDLIQKQITELEKQLDRLPLAQRQLVSIQRNYTLLENLYVFLMQKMSEAGISKASNVSDIVMVNPPMLGGAISPSTGRNYFFGWLIGLAIPVIAFVALEFFNQRIQSKEDVEKITSIPFIGGIGHNRSKDNLAVSLSPKSPVAESFRAIRSNLNYFTGNQVKKIFMVSSSISGEGKTFCSVNLATVFALSEKKTLIIGADMRKPKIYSDFNLNNIHGLSGYLSGLSTFSEVLQHTSIENLDLISGGPVPPNPSELLLNGKIEILLQDALKEYDYIVIDTPPLAFVTDAFVLAKYADHTVFLTRQNYTPIGFLKDINDFYVTDKLKNISIVLNDIYKSGLGYGYGYGDGYGYGRRQNDGGYYS